MSSGAETAAPSGAGAGSARLPTFHARYCSFLSFKLINSVTLCSLLRALFIFFYICSALGPWHAVISYDACVRLCLNAWSRGCQEAPMFLENECNLLRDAFGLVFCNIKSCFKFHLYTSGSIPFLFTSLLLKQIFFYSLEE